MALTPAAASAARRAPRRTRVAARPDRGLRRSARSGSARFAGLPAPVEVTVEAAAHALHHEPHRRARQRGETFHAIDRVALRRAPATRRSTCFARRHVRLHDDRIEFVVMMVDVAFVVGGTVVIVAQMDRVFRRRFETEQRMQIELRPSARARSSPAAGISSRISASTALCCASSSRSVLFRITRSAAANWSSNNSCNGDS